VDLRWAARILTCFAIVDLWSDEREDLVSHEAWWRLYTNAMVDLVKAPEFLVLSSCAAPRSLGLEQRRTPPLPVLSLSDRRRAMLLRATLFCGDLFSEWWRKAGTTVCVELRSLHFDSISRNANVLLTRMIATSHHLVRA